MISLALGFIVAGLFAQHAVAFPQQFMLRGAGAPPPNPTGLTNGVITASTVYLAWTSGGGSTATYKIAYQSGGTPPADCASGTILTSGVASTTVTGLTPSTQYSYRVCAVDAASVVSSGVTLSITQLGPPPAPTAVAGFANGTTQITASWATGGGSTTSFIVAYQSGGTAPSDCTGGTAAPGGAGATSLSFTGLAATTTYSFRVCARDAGLYHSTGVTGSATTRTSNPTWYSGITYYADGGTLYSGCVAPNETTMNDESVAPKTTYGSATDTNAYVRADLGSMKTVSAVRVGGSGPTSCWGSASFYWLLGAPSILFQTSPDAATWTTRATGNGLTYADASMQTVTFAPVSARYVRIFSASYWIATGQFRIGN